MDMQTDLTSIILELTQLSPLFTLKEESIYISSLLFLFQTPEQFTQSSVPLKVLRLLEHKYSICAPDKPDTQETTLIENSLLSSLDPVNYPGLLFLLFSPTHLSTHWVQQSFSTDNDLITTTNLHGFRFSLEVIFTHLHTSKRLTGSSFHPSVITEFLSSSDLGVDEQNAHFFTSLVRILQLFTPEALSLLLNSNRNGEILLAEITHSLSVNHIHTYSSLIHCLVTLLDKLGFTTWKYIDDVSLTFLVTNLIASPCLLFCLEEWNSLDTVPLRDVVFSWCKPYFSCITHSHNALKHSKIIFKWLTYLCDSSSSISNYKYTEITFVDIILETLPTPNFQSTSPIANASAVLFFKLLMNAFSDNLLGLLLATKEYWHPLFKVISTASSTQQSPDLQLSFKYFQRHNRFEVSPSSTDSYVSLNVFRQFHELIVMVFNSGLQYSLPSAESIVGLCKQKQPINKVNVKILSILKALKDSHEEESGRTSILIDLRGDDDIEEILPEILDRFSSPVDTIDTPVSEQNQFPSADGSISGNQVDVNCNREVTDNIFVSVNSPDTTVPDNNDTVNSSMPTNSSTTVVEMDEPNDNTATIQNEVYACEMAETNPVTELPVQIPKNLVIQQEINDSSEPTKQMRVLSRKRKIEPEKQSLKVMIDLKNLQRVPIKPERISNLKKSIIRSNVSASEFNTNSPIAKTSTPVLKLQRNFHDSTSAQTIHTESPLLNISFVPSVTPNEIGTDNHTSRILDITTGDSVEKEKTSSNQSKENSPSSPNYERLKNDLYLSQLSPDEDEEPPLVFTKPVKLLPQRNTNVTTNPNKRKKTNVTTTRPPFSKSRLTSLTHTSTSETNIDYSKPDTLYKRAELAKSKAHPYPFNVPVDIEFNISQGEITRLNDKAKLSIQPCKIRTSPNKQTHSSQKNAAVMKKRPYPHSQNMQIISKPTCRINPDEHIDNILSWSPDIFLREGNEPRGMPPIPFPSPLPLSYRSYDEYKQLFTNCLLHEISSNLDEEMERMVSVTFQEFYTDKTCTYKDENRSVLVEFTRNTAPENNELLLDFVKEQDLVLMKIKSKPPDPINDVLLFGYLSKYRVDRSELTEKDQNPFQRTKHPVSKLFLHIKYDTRHVISKFSKLFLKPLISLTTYNRQWRGLIHLYKNSICQSILLPSLRACDPPCNPSLSKIRVPNEQAYNESQKQAITKITYMVSEPLPCSRIALLLGPPGCGKSHTITGLLQTILKNYSSDRLKHHILLCAPSNAAADELALKLIHMDLINREKTLQTIQRSYSKNVLHKAGEVVDARLTLIRLGNLDVVHPLVKPFHIDNLIASAKQNCASNQEASLGELEASKVELENNIKRLEVEVECLKLSIETMGSSLALRSEVRDSEKSLEANKLKLSSTTRDISRLHHSNNTKVPDIRLKESILSNVNIILTTLSSSGISMMEEMFKENTEKPMHFSCVIVDEATQCNELDVLIPLQFMITKLVLVGDPNQLPAVVKSPLLQGNGFGRSLFERFELFFSENCNNENPIMRLDTQYRMHPQICHFPNISFYMGKLLTNPEVELRSESILNPYLLFHISYGQETSNKPGQIINTKEIEFVSAIIDELLTKFDASSIGVITPYQAQLKEITKSISKQTEKIEVKSVDGFQGKEKEIIIISCVRSKSKTGTIGFLSNSKRINVAITRAKKALYIVGDVDSLKRNPTWNKLIQDAETRERLLTIHPMHIQDSVRKIWLKN